MVIGYKQARDTSIKNPTLTAFATEEKRRKEREKELMRHSSTNMDFNCILVNDGSIAYYDTALKTGILFRDDKNPAKTFVSLGYYPKDKTFTNAKNWMKFPCFEFDKTFDPGINSLVRVIRELITLACVHKLVNLSKNQEGIIVNIEYPLRNFLSQIFTPSYYMREADRRFRKLNGKI